MKREIERAIFAAGALCWRVIDGRIHLLVIHRPQYGDVTIPKGKVDPGETLPQAAVREIEEETGLRVALGVPLGESRYAMPGRFEKVVHYWAAEVSDAAIQRSTFRPNGEVSALEWVTIKRARGYLSYQLDIDIVDRFAALVDQGVTSTFPLIVLRHAKATARSDFAGTDQARTLTERGIGQAAELVNTVVAWGPKRIVTSSAIRCVATVTPLAAALGRAPRRLDGLSQDAFDQGADEVRRVVGKRVRKGLPAVICSHRPVLPLILKELALATGTPVGPYLTHAGSLAPAAFSVVHLSATNPASGIIAIETHQPPD